MASQKDDRGRLIVVAVDPSEESLHALAWCLHNVIGVVKCPDEVGEPKDTLLLLYARTPPDVYPDLDGTGKHRWNLVVRDGYLVSSDVAATMERQGKEVADGVIRRARKVCADNIRVKVESTVEVGDPRDVICDVVEKLGAHLLVIGSHGYGLIKRTFLGSVSNYCAQNAMCPVLIVKSPTEK